MNGHMDVHMDVRTNGQTGIIRSTWKSWLNIIL